MEKVFLLDVFTFVECKIEVVDSHGTVFWNNFENTQYSEGKQPTHSFRYLPGVTPTAAVLSFCAQLAVIRVKMAATLLFIVANMYLFIHQLCFSKFMTWFSYFLILLASLENVFNTFLFNTRFSFIFYIFIIHYIHKKQFIQNNF